MTDNDKAFPHYIKIELICYTEADKDEIFALTTDVSLQTDTEVLTWYYKCGKCGSEVDSLTSTCYYDHEVVEITERCNNE